MINRTDFFALLFFQIAVTSALAAVVAKRNCTHCESRTIQPSVAHQLVAADH
jgi:hypothetical protein